MSKYVTCTSLSDLESKTDELYEEYSHVEFVQWLPDNTVEFFVCN